jgi:transcriptional regulator of acetoin/glycerol metabolism
MTILVSKVLNSLPDLGGSMIENISAYFKKTEQPPLIVQKRIRDSHRRSLRSRLDSNLDQLTDVWKGDALVALLSKNERLIFSGKEVFELIHRMLPDKSCIFMLTNRQARVMALFSTPEMICQSANKGIQPGASLAEKSCGTNAVALAIKYKERIVLKGVQHFARLLQDWSCIAVPVFDMRNNSVVACVALSLSSRAEIGEKIPIVELIARELVYTCRSQINQFTASNRSDEERSLSPRQSIVLQMVMEGLNSKEIASFLGISPRTVESHLEVMRKRFGAKTTSNLIAIFLRSNYLVNS